jgi:hypothetical protein
MRPPTQPTKDRIARDEDILREQRVVRLNVSPPHGGLLRGVFAKGGQFVVHETISCGIRVVKDRGCQVTLVGFVDADEIL